jgi:hypothetical protein
MVKFFTFWSCASNDAQLRETSGLSPCPLQAPFYFFAGVALIFAGNKLGNWAKSMSFNPQKK